MLFARRFRNNYYFPVIAVAGIVTGISFVTRVLLMLQSAAVLDWSFKNIIGAFVIGLFYDLVIASYFIIPMVLHTWLMTNAAYSRKGKILVPLLFVIVMSLFLFTRIVPKDFNEYLTKFITWYFIIRLLLYISLCFAGKGFRIKWRRSILLFDTFLITYVLLLNACSEWFFWDEFSTRYNFIAVDYLVYTNEVLGNIWESYHVVWLLAGIFIACLLLVFAIRKKLFHSLENRPAFINRTVVSLSLLLLPALSYFFVTSGLRKFSTNEYVNELAGNGIFEFGTAFWHNQLDFYKFYKTLPDKEAFAIIHKELEGPNSTFTSTNIFNLERTIKYQQPEKRMNVVLISVESLSASFMKAFGSKENITPYLDSLALKSLFFTNLYASGTRTVRGLEALSLSLPPTPGQSIVKRPENENLFTLGSVFNSKGYTSQYIYGGYGYFDNMNYYFSNNGYQVIDRKALNPAQIHYANIWGVADEDLFTLALQVMDNNYSLKKPFFSHVMTVSNHRPYTYPDGRIDIPSSQQSRQGAVKYTDYAIGKFIREAAVKPWFGNTIFVIVADHCAGSAGSSQLPVTGYHIPMLIYSPSNVQAQKIETLVSQIDIGPTILGLLKFNYRSKFFGQDIFALPAGKERAFISTYQGLGFLKNGELIIQSPVKKVEEYKPDFITGKALRQPLTDSLVKQAISYYQCASWLIRNGKYGK
jgi:phosphoglycerol transferase MdoB-like AlkP superfamily enzyme